jgi:hypothetical protein
MGTMRITIVAGVVFFLFSGLAGRDASGQVLRRDPAEQKAPLSIGGRSYAPDGEGRVGPFVFHPFASERLEWNDNIFLIRRFEQEDDVISNTLFGVRTDWTMGRHETLLGYQGRYEAYTRHADESFLQHDLNLVSQWNFDWFFLDVKNRFGQRKEPEPEEEDIITERSENTLGLETGVYVDRIGFELSYTFTWFDFVDPAMRMLDHNEHFVSFGGYYLLREDSKLTQKLYAFLDVTYGGFRHRERILSDSNQLTAYLGVKGTIFDRLATVVKVGYGGIDPTGNGSLPDTDGFRGLMYLASVMYMPSVEQNIRLSTSRHMQTSAGSNYRVFDRLEAAYKYVLFERLALGATLFYDHAKPSYTRNLSRWGYKVEAEVDLQPWLSLGADWAFTARTGKRVPGAPGLNYRNHIVQFWLTLYI